MIAIGSDHGGFQMKKELMLYLESKGIEFKDFGTYSEDSCDYPVYAKAVSNAVAKGEAEKGILVCGTGIGMSIAANKIKGIRASSVTNEYSAEFTRRHNLVRWGKWSEHVSRYSDSSSLRTRAKNYPCLQYYPIPDEQVVLSNYNLDNKEYDKYGL